MSLNYVSLGGWCGSKMAFKQARNFDEATLPFDNVRSSMEGVVDCFENHFANFFPTTIERESRITSFTAYRGRYVSFFHDNLLDSAVIDSYKRRFQRFHDKLLEASTNGTKVVFVRSVICQDYRDETKYVDKLCAAIESRYPSLKYIVAFVISKQERTVYCGNSGVGAKAFLFALDKRTANETLGVYYKPIFDFIETQDMFETIPPLSAESIAIDTVTPVATWFVEGIPALKGDEE